MLHRKDRNNKKRIYKNTISLLFQHSFSLLFGQGIFMVISILLLTPFLSFVYHLALSVSGYSYITVNNIGLFLLNPLIMIMLIILFVVIGLFLLYEACYLVTFYSLIENGEKPKQLKILGSSLKKLLFIIIRRNFTLLPMVWLIVILSNIPLFLFIIKRVRIFWFITETMDDNPFTLPITAVLTILLLWLMLRKLFLFLYYLIEGKIYSKTNKSNRKKDKSDAKTVGENTKYHNSNIKADISDTKKVIKNIEADIIDAKKDKGNKKSNGSNTKTDSFKSNKNINKITTTIRTLFYFIGWNIVIIVVSLLLYLLTMAITALFVAGIPDKSLAIATYLSINDNMNGYFIAGIFSINTIANFALYTHLFFQYKKERNENITVDTSADNLFINVDAYKNIIRIAVAIIAVMNFYFFYDIVRNGSPLDYMNLDRIRVTSHRGFSRYVPENTLTAVEKAMEEQADSIEVDVRVTKDGELVLLHDNNLKRTTGVNKKIWNVDYGEVSLLDAGSWMDEAYAGTRIPTLREVFELCKGKVNLNLDLKYRSAAEGLVEKVVALIEEYEMEWQCVITSTSLTVLENVKELNPDIRTGYITYQIYQGYYNNGNIDFFSIKSNLATKTVTREVHKNGKAIHVWTVNSENELERMKMIGVDNIITDDPSYAKEVLYQEDSNRFLVTLLKIMME